MRDNGVLLVEDDFDIREALGEALKDEGFAVVSVATGLAALEYLQSTPELPALILLDLMMPGLDGWQFRAEQRKNSAWLEIPVIVLSAGADLHEKATALGASGYQRKPIDIDALLSMMSAMISA